MNLHPPLRAPLTAIALASLSACATYDDSAMHQACQPIDLSGKKKDL